MSEEKKDLLVLGGQEFSSRFILGSGKYSLDLIQAAVEHAGAQIITLALRRANAGGTANILDYIPDGVTLLPNTSGARTADEAVRIARLSREVGCGNFVKIEIMRDSKYLLPDNQETVKATEILANEGFVVMPAVMANTGIATAGDVPAMAEAFKKAIEAGRTAYLSGTGRVLERGGSASSPLTGYIQDGSQTCS